jgi:hypothetical protein
MTYAKLIILPAYQMHSGNAAIIHLKQNLEDKQWDIMATLQDRSWDREREKITLTDKNISWSYCEQKSDLFLPTFFELSEEYQRSSIFQKLLL